MSRKKISANSQTKNARRKTKSPRGASLSYRYRLLMFGCGLCLIAGFFFAARQHFSSIDFSIKNSRLRKLSEELESDKRRLLLTKEIALSPSEIKKAAQKIGFKAMTAGSAGIVRPAAAKPAKPRAEKPDAPKSKQSEAIKAAEAATEKVPAKKTREEKPAEAKIKRETSQPAK